MFMMLMKVKITFCFLIRKVKFVNNIPLSESALSEGSMKWNLHEDEGFSVRLKRLDSLPTSRKIGTVPRCCFDSISNAVFYAMLCFSHIVIINYCFWGWTLVLFNFWLWQRHGKNLFNLLCLSRVYKHFLVL